MRLRKIPQAFAYLEEANHVLLDSTIDKKLQHTPTQQIALEIGCGKGDFIIAQAQAHPNVQYYALEKYDSVLFKAAQKADVLNLANLTFILGDAANLNAIFESNIFDKIYLNFSDPWPKLRHAKRRLTHESKLRLYKELLQVEGVIELKTDNEGFFNSSLDELKQADWRIDALCVDLYNTTDFSEIKAYQTEYEKKFIARGKPIYYVCARQG